MSDEKIISSLFKKHVLPKKDQPKSYMDAFHRLCYSNEKLLTDYQAQYISALEMAMEGCLISDVSIKLIYGMATWNTKPNCPYRRTLILS